MPTFTDKSVKSAIYLPIAVGVAALVALAGSASAAAAPPAAVTSLATGTQVAAKPLATALVGESDVPKGYKSTGDPTEEKTMMLDPSTDPCDMTGSSTTTEHMVHYASTSFAKGDNSLSETLMVEGAKNARAEAAVLTTMLRDCPVIDDEESTMKMSLYPVELPALGDVSSALRYVIALGDDPADVMRGEVIVFALHGTSATIQWDGATDPNERQVAKVATKALEKLKKYQS
jgi:hypothetical protein